MAPRILGARLFLSFRKIMASKTMIMILVRLIEAIWDELVEICRAKKKVIAEEA